MEGKKSEVINVFEKPKCCGRIEWAKMCQRCEIPREEVDGSVFVE